MIPAGMQTTGARVMVTAAPYYTEGGTPHFVSEVKIADRGIAVGEPDEEGDVLVYFPKPSGVPEGVCELSPSCLTVMTAPP